MIRQNAWKCDIIKVTALRSRWQVHLYCKALDLVTEINLNRPSNAHVQLKVYLLTANRSTVYHTKRVLINDFLKPSNSIKEVILW